MTGTGETLSVLACQITVPPTIAARDRDDHLTATREKVRARLAARSADLVVLPELSSIDYSRAAFDQLDEIAEPIDGASFQCWRALAVEFGVHICYSFAFRSGTSTYISMAVVTPEGTLSGHYEKLHMCQYGASMEKEYFSAGDHIFVFQIGAFRIAPIICYDIRIPELARALTLRHGVDLILHCGAYYRDESFATWHDFTTTRAMENQIFLLSLNRAGPAWGNSVFCRPWMDENNPPERFADTAEDFRYLTIGKPELNAARGNYTFLKDRLPDYDAL
jgi:nitrilase